MELKNERVAGKASVERPWLNYYPDEMKNMELPDCTLNEYMRTRSHKGDDTAIHYYGTDITWDQFFTMVDQTTRALRAMGVGENTQLPVLLRSVPEFIVLLLAAERVGAAVLCRDNTVPENAEAIARSGGHVMVIHDFLSQEELDAYAAAGIERFITVSPYRLAKAETMPDYVKGVIERSYPAQPVRDDRLMDWDAFIALGGSFEGGVQASEDHDRPLLRVYTSGSTGPSKQVIHSARTIISVTHQYCFYAGDMAFRPTWLVTILPPSLVAVVITMLLMPMASNRVLILDPFLEVEDLDLEIMRYRPNFWPHIPMFIETLMRSRRLPEDYDLSHLLATGAGCEAVNNVQLENIKAFLAKHNYLTPYTLSYGQSEAGSGCVMPVFDVPARDGCVGIPVPLNNMGVFRAGTEEELDYGEIGELCVAGPGMMLGYGEDVASDTSTLRTHSDGTRWLHTGDQGFIDEHGCVHVLGRGEKKRHSGGILLEVAMENKVSDARIPGVKDAFFVAAPDPEHEGYFLPYLYVALQEGVAPGDIREAVDRVLEAYERPVEIFQVPERPFFHFKTARVEKVRELRERTR